MKLAEQRPVVVACLDIGSPRKGNVGWAVVDGETRATGSDLSRFVAVLGQHLLSERRVAVGFECPLYVPKRSDVGLMTAPRLGETGLNWCGGPGASVLATGLAQVNWVLAGVAAHAPKATATTRWQELKSGKATLFCWEAFITSKSGVKIALGESYLDSPHERDALCGALAFSRAMDGQSDMPSDLGREPALSLIGLHLLETGLSTDKSLLSGACTVLKVRKTA